MVLGILYGRYLTHLYDTPVWVFACTVTVGAVRAVGVLFSPCCSLKCARVRVAWVGARWVPFAVCSLVMGWFGVAAGSGSLVTGYSSSLLRFASMAGSGSQKV